jgi:SAM-dependent methyltransferase
MTQAALRRKAVAKFGTDAAAMFFTRTGLEQATRAVVAARRASRLAASGATTVADLGCGIGADALAFARAGLNVVAIESDPLTAEVARANAAALGLANRITVSTMDAVDADLSIVDAVFCDPARRTATGRRVFSQAGYRPPWDFISGLPGRVPRTVLKLAPGIDHAVLPESAEGQWVSVDGQLVEATAWCGPLARTPRRASVLRGGAVHELTGSGEALAPVQGVRRYLYDPDPAVVRAHLVAEFASTVDGVLADGTIAYVYCEQPAPTPLARGYEIMQPLPVSVKPLRAALRGYGIGSLEILKRGSALDPQTLRRQLRLSGSRSATLVLTRVAGRQVALLCQPT